MSDVASCSQCLATATADAGLEAVYAVIPDDVPSTAPSGDPSNCLRRVGKATRKLTGQWVKHVTRCERDNATGRNQPAIDCSTDPGGKIAAAQAKTAVRIGKCTDFTGLPGCASSGDAAMTTDCITAALDTVDSGLRRGGLPMRRVSLVGILALAATVVLVQTDAALARPSYFTALKARYSIPDASNLDSCGVCHFQWTGAGARTLYGTDIEQQLYLGKTIDQSLADIETRDSDEDTFTNVEELVTYLTLPGYNCANFQLAVGAPAGYDTYITPLVASCLEPLDISVAPLSVSFLTDAGDVETLQISVRNNGKSEIISISDYGLLGGASPELSVLGPPAPLDIPVGGELLVDLEFAPTGTAFSLGTLRIESNDPDESIIDVPIVAFGLVHVVAPPPERQACMEKVSSALSRYTRKHLRMWNACHLDQLVGFACKDANRDRILAKHAAKLRDRVGGERDRACEGADLSASLLDYPETCGGTCDTVPTTSIDGIADCLLCRQDEAMQTSLTAGTGSAPPRPARKPVNRPRRSQLPTPGGP